MKNVIVGLTIEADRTYFSDPVRVIVSRSWRGGRPNRVYHARPASALRAARAMLMHVQRIVDIRVIVYTRAAPSEPIATTQESSK